MTGKETGPGLIHARRPKAAGERPGISPAAASAAFAAFAILGVVSRAGLTRDSDERARSRIRPRKSPRLTRAATAASAFGAPHMRPVFAGSVALACRALGAKNPWRILAASLCATALNKSTRLFLHQQRPPGAGIHRGLDAYAYPSGHCCAVAAVMTAAVRQLSKDKSKTARAALAAGGAGISLATAWSRLYLDEHWLDDVIGGLFAGVAIGLTVTER